ncbi:MAG: hypothetical protein AAFQ41_03225 [Cyanobacteria bacterium J06623_7]
MSNRWAAIVYGRTYHLDFRFITVPHDFTPPDLNWAASHIVATTQGARNLAASPRWSLFKSDRFCVVGTTCMIKELLGQTVKDDRGRPLYAFFGYATPLDSGLSLDNLPPYSDCLADFQPLYGEIERVWSVKNYESNSTKPALSQYASVKFSDAAIAQPLSVATQLNLPNQHPEQIYLWPNQLEKNKRLWQASAHCPQTVAVCLNIKGKPLVNSPFLNQSHHQTHQFQILERVISTGKYHQVKSLPSMTGESNPTLSAKITHRAKEDIDLTLQQATKVAIAGQELISNLADWNQLQHTEEAPAENPPEEPFGFKKKDVGCPPDWF